MAFLIDSVFSRNGLILTSRVIEALLVFCEGLLKPLLFINWY